MLYYEVKLINPETKEVFFNVTSTKPKLPPQELLNRHRGAIIVIRTNPPEMDPALDLREPSEKLQKSA